MLEKVFAVDERNGTVREGKFLERIELELGILVSRIDVDPAGLQTGAATAIEFQWRATPEPLCLACRLAMQNENLELIPKLAQRGGYAITEVFSDEILQRHRESLRKCALSIAENEAGEVQNEMLLKGSEPRA